MIYPGEYKCGHCKKYHTYGCKYRGIKGMLSCSNFVDDGLCSVGPYPKHLGLYRCLFGVCPRQESLKRNNKIK